MKNTLLLLLSLILFTSTILCGYESVPDNSREENIPIQYLQNNCIDESYDEDCWTFMRPFITTWKTDSEGVSCNTCVTIPTFPGETYNYEIDWNYDGATFDVDTSGVGGDATHNYGVADTYTVAIRGDFPRIYCNGLGASLSDIIPGEARKLIAVDQWGDIEWRSMEQAFAGCENLLNADLLSPNLTEVISIQSMFRGASSFNSDLSNWDVSFIENMEGTFDGASSFNGNIGNWNVSNVTSMRIMFQVAVSFNSDLSNWEVENVTDMMAMFAGASSFNSDINNWKVGNVLNVRSMFNGASNFNSNLNSWKVGNVTDMAFMFNGASSFNSDINNWDVENVTDMAFMFSGSNSFDNNLSLWNLSSIFDDVNEDFDALAGILDNSGLSRANYEATLLGWANNPNTPVNLTLGAENLIYCDSIGRSSLINSKGWTIAGDSQDPSCDESPFANMTPFVTTWKTDNEGVSCNTCVTIPTFPGENYNYEIDWDYDGTTFNVDSSSVGGDAMHDYGVARTYTIAIRGEFPQIYCKGIGNTIDDIIPSEAQKLIRVDQWGDIEWRSMTSAFEGCSNLETVALDEPNLSQVISLAQMFRGALIFNSDINFWDVSNVQFYAFMFEEANNFNSSLNQWDVSNAEIMAGMFQGATSFNQDISNWQMNNVSNVVYMFNGASAFNSNLNSWELSNVTDFEGMFLGASTFNSDLSSWQVENVTNMREMFSEAISFNSDVSQWDVSNIEDLARMFNGATSFNSDLSGWDVSNVVSMWTMFQNAESFNANIGTWDLNSIVDNPGDNNDGLFTMLGGSGLSQLNYESTLEGWANNPNTPNNLTLGSQNLIYCDTTGRASLTNDKGWTILGDSQDPTCEESPFAFMAPFVTTWKTDNEGVSCNTCVTIPTFPGEEYNYEIDWNYDGITFDVDTSGVGGDASHDYGVADTYTVAIRGDFPRIYCNGFGLLNNDFIPGEAIKLITVGQWGDIAWSSMEDAFEGCNNLTVVDEISPNLSNVTSLNRMFSGSTNFNSPINLWNVENVTDMILMFFGASSFNQEIGSWNVGNVRDMQSMFLDASSFNQEIGSWNVENVTNMRFMFGSSDGNTSSFNQEVGSWNVDNVTNMSLMFAGANSFNQELNSWNVGNVTDMSRMFSRASSFNQELSSWDVSNVTDMSNMFSRASSFNQELRLWNVGKVTDMSCMFEMAENFNSNLESWNVENVTNMSLMFSVARSFNSDISLWDVSNVTDMGTMFQFAESFNSDLSRWDVSNVTSMGVMFVGATNFESDLSSWDVSKVTTMLRMFNGANSFESDLNSWDVSSVTDMFGMFKSALKFDSNLGSWDLRSIIDLPGRESDMLGDMLNNSGLSQSNYESTLLGWSQNPNTPNNITLGAESLVYCDELGRDSLINNLDWIILGDIKIPDCDNECRPRDSLVLVELYNNTGQVLNWNLNQSIDTWEGVETDINGCVVQIDLKELNLSGALPQSFYTLSELNLVDIGGNNLSGDLTDLDSLFNLTFFDISTNGGFTGSLPDFNNLPNLTWFGCSENQISGLIISLENCPLLENFSCFDNQILGAIPDISSLNLLHTANFGSNNFTGQLPNITTLQRLEFFGCADNSLNGELPDISTLNNLTTVYIQNSGLSGTFPDISGLDNLSTFYCQDNNFSGCIDIPSNLCSQGFSVSPEVLFGYNFSNNAGFSNNGDGDFLCTTSSEFRIIADAGVDLSLTCDEEMVTLDASGSTTIDNVTYTWTNEFFNILGNTPTLEVDEPGTYTLSIQDLNSNCPESFDIIEVFLNETLPFLNMPNDITLDCEENSTTLVPEVNTMVNYSWELNGNVLSNMQSINAQQAGSYSLTITDTNNGCTNSGETMVTLDEDIPQDVTATGGTIDCLFPNVTLSSSSTTPNVTFQWQGMNTNFSSSESNPEVSQADIYRLTVTNPVNGCSTFVEVEVISDRENPFSDAGSNQQLIQGETIILDGSASAQGPNFTYSWTTLDGNILSGAETLQATINLPGLYELLVTNTDNGCTSIDEVIVSLEQDPLSVSRVLIDTIQGKFRDTLQIDLKVFGFFEKDNFEIGVKFDNQKFEFIDVIEVTDRLGLYSKDDVQLLDFNRIFTSWSSNNGTTKSIPDGESLLSFRLVVLSQECNVFDLEFSDLDIALGDNNTMFPNVRENGVIVLEQEPGSQCDDGNPRTELEVFQQDCTCETLTLSNIITPEESPGYNDVLKFNDDEIIEDSRLTILNRWGNKVFEKTNYTNDWNASDVPAGIYFYILEIGDRTFSISLTVVK